MIGIPNKERAASVATMGNASIGDAPRKPAAQRCVVVGATARAFVESARRMGWAAHAADLFGDVDLAAAAVDVVRLGASGVAPYPDGIPGVVSSLPDGVCVYTGGLENHPNVIAAIAAVRPVAGCSADAIRRVRDPTAMAAVVRDAGLRFPDTYPSPTGLPTDGSFLVKPLRSAGGRGVRRWRGDGSDLADRDLVWQEFVHGDGRSASYVARNGTAQLVGSSCPLTEASWCGGRPFAYCGSVDDPLDGMPDGLRQTLEHLGAAVAAAFDLAGLFGIDLVVDATGEVHVLEVNPRPTASMELIERSTGWSVAAAHLAAGGWCAEPRRGVASGTVWAKAIAYAPAPVGSAPSVAEIIAAFADRWTAADGLAAVADIPRADEQPVPGTPLVTVFARGDTHDHAVATLRSRVVLLRRAAAHGLSPPAAFPSEAWRLRGSTA